MSINVNLNIFLEEFIDILTVILIHLLIGLYLKILYVKLDKLVGLWVALLLVIIILI